MAHAHWVQNGPAISIASLLGACIRDLQWGCLPNPHHQPTPNASCCARPLVPAPDLQRSLAHISRLLAAVVRALPAAPMSLLPPQALPAARVVPGRPLSAYSRVHLTAATAARSARYCAGAAGAGARRLLAPRPDVAAHATPPQGQTLPWESGSASVSGEEDWEAGAGMDDTAARFQAALDLMSGAMPKEEIGALRFLQVWTCRPAGCTTRLCVCVRLRRGMLRQGSARPVHAQPSMLRAGAPRIRRPGREGLHLRHGR